MNIKTTKNTVKRNIRARSDSYKRFTNDNTHKRYSNKRRTYDVQNNRHGNFFLN